VDNLQSRVQQLFPGEVPTRQYVLRRVYEMIRQQIAAA